MDIFRGKMYTKSSIKINMYLELKTYFTFTQNSDDWERNTRNPRYREPVDGANRCGAVILNHP